MHYTTILVLKFDNCRLRTGHDMVDLMQEIEILCKLHVYCLIILYTAIHY